MLSTHMAGGVGVGSNYSWADGRYMMFAEALVVHTMCSVTSIAFVREKLSKTVMSVDAPSKRIKFPSFKAMIPLGDDDPLRRLPCESCVLLSGKTVKTCHC
jgi:hypothetical protein